MKNLKFVFACFRHSHSRLIYNAVKNTVNTEITACYEGDEQTIDKLHQETSIRITHRDYKKMLAEVDCDVVVIGDYYNNRGSLAIAAMEQGKHIISDKPLCTSLDEVNKIRQLSLKKKLSVGCMLSLRDFGVFRTLKDMISAGQLGEVQSVSILGLHPLNINGRPQWYRDRKYYCGVLNDLGPHCFDLVEWLGGVNIKEISYARVWNGKAKDYPDFQDCGQFSAVCENNAGILCDLSYLAPEKLGYGLPQYWRITCYGKNGMAETGLSWDKVLLASDSDTEPRAIQPQANMPNSYLNDFMNEIKGVKDKNALLSANVFRAMELSIKAQFKAVK
jgi:predicted dehydrogenase